jgi:glucokinase
LQFPYPILVCDIGGTNVRISRSETPGGPLNLLGHVKTADYAGLAEAIESLPDWHPGYAESVIACGAGPVGGRALSLTNAPWRIDGPEIAARLRLKQGLLLNDFEAQALALPVLPDQWLHRIGDAGRIESGTRLIMGPGTGLGIAGLTRIGDRWFAFSSEAGHVDFGPVGVEEEAVWPHLDRVHGRVTAESVCSGPGLARLHRARLIAEGSHAPQLDGVTIVDRALQNPTGDEAATIRLFWRLIARFSGDMALAFLARGGVTLSGGVLPRIVDLLDSKAFREAFEDKAPMAKLLADVATQILIAPDAVLAGMAAIAAHPQAYVLDYEARAWVSLATC